MKKGLIICLILVFVAFLFILYTPHVWRLFYPLHYEEIVFEVSNKYDLDPYLVFSVIRVESKFKEDAVSRRGAVGLMQIMPSTGMWLARQESFDVSNKEELLNPEKNIKLGCCYLKSLYYEFESKKAALAAYNAGPGRVQNWLELGVWDGSKENIDDIPYKETREYVKSVLKTYEIYKEIYDTH